MGVTVFSGKVTRVTMDGVFASFGGLIIDGLDAKQGDDIVCSVQLVTPPKPKEVTRSRTGDIEKGRPSRPGA